MNAHNMFVAVYVRAVIHCLLTYTSRFVYAILFAAYNILLCRIALFNRTNINIFYASNHRPSSSSLTFSLSEVVAPSSYCQSYVDLFFFSLY